ncbi:MAG: NAD(P)H-hydrate epimerase [Flexilinea sp.]|nr:NAD(P)H-hydrate epimerase [Flexilinea sp.]
MDIISVQKMREADQYTISKGTPSKELMRRAAQGVFDTYPGWSGAKTLIVCGPGNNGGDGYALASIMKDKDLDVTVLCSSDKFSEDGAFYYKQCTEKGVPVLSYETGKIDFKAYNIIVDCLLGTGFQGVPKDPIASIIGEINYARETSDIYVISVDINSGMNGDTGESENAVVSDLTISIGFYKTGLFSEKGMKLIGGLANVDIGIELP